MDREFGSSSRLTYVAFALELYPLMFFGVLLLQCFSSASANGWKAEELQAISKTLHSSE